MSWTYVFWYSAILVVISIIGRFFDVANTTWQQNSTAYKAQDVFDVLLVSFGLVGLFGLAFDESYLGQALWQGYFIFSMVYLLVLFWTPKFNDMKAMYGNRSVVKAIFSNTLLMVPAHVGQYNYAFLREWA